MFLIELIVNDLVFQEVNKEIWFFLGESQDHPPSGMNFPAAESPSHGIRSITLHPMARPFGFFNSTASLKLAFGFFHGHGNVDRSFLIFRAHA